MKVTGSRCHAHFGDGNRIRERVRSRCTRDSHPEANEGVTDEDDTDGGGDIPEEVHREKAEGARGKTQEERDARAEAFDEAARERRGHNHEQRTRHNRGSGLQRVVAENVLQKLLPHIHGPHERTKNDYSGYSRHPKRWPSGIAQVKER